MTEMETMAKVRDELARRGLDATFEYPGFIAVGGGVMNFGTASGETWGGEHYASLKAMEDGEQPAETFDSLIPHDCEDVQRIANWIVECQPEDAPLTREEMESQFQKAMGLLWDLCYQHGFNDAVAAENGGRYDLPVSFEEFLCELGDKVRFIPAAVVPVKAAAGKAPRKAVWK